MKTGKLVHESFLAAALACVPLAGMTALAGTGTDGPWRPTKQSADHSVEQGNRVPGTSQVSASRSEIRKTVGGSAGSAGVRQVQHLENGTRRNGSAHVVTPVAQGNSAQNPNPSVVSELNRLFQENGQQMPSMRQEDLPNANVHRPQIKRQGTESAQLSTGSGSGQQVQGQGSAAAPRKQNIFQKFVGRLRGRGAQSADSAEVPSRTGDGRQDSLSDRSAPAPGQPRAQAGKPPVLPIQPPAMVPPADPPEVAIESRKTPNGRRPSAGSQSADRSVRSGTRAASEKAREQTAPTVRSASRPQTGGSGGATSAATPARRPQVSREDRSSRAPAPTQSSAGALRTRSAAQKSAVPAVPPALHQPSGGLERPSAASSSALGENLTRDFVQPGTAPAFMPSAVRPSTVRATPVAPHEERITHEKAAPNSGTAADTTGRRELRSTAAAASAAPVKSPGRDDDFVDPFEEQLVPGAPDEYLDLDSLIEPSDSLEAPAASDPVPAADSAGEIQAAPAALTDSPAAAEQPESEPASEVLVNPFTGVRLSPGAATGGANTAGDGRTGGTEFESPVGDDDSEDADDLDADDHETGDPGSGNQRPPGPVPGVRPGSSGIPDDGATDDLLPSVEDLPEHPAAAPRAPVKATPTGLRRSLDGAARPEAARPEAARPEAARSGAARPEAARSGADDELPVLAPVPTDSAAVTPQADLRHRVISSRTGRKGFKGFCPVALRDEQQLVDSDPEIHATFGLQQYTFSSAAARSAFESDPARYAPAVGGSDVVLLVTSGEEEAGLLDYSVWYRDRLYLFRSRETMEMFNFDPAAYADQY